MSNQSIDAVAARLRVTLEKKNSVRETALRLCRETIQASARAIRAVHRREFDESGVLVAQARDAVNRTRDALADHPDLYHAGYVHDAQKEYVEAEAVRAMVLSEPIPPPEALGVQPAAYLNGLAEAGSECRRYVLDLLREGRPAEADRVLQAMDEIYFELITFDFPDAITGGLRRTTDAFRAVLERTRGDLALTFQQQALAETLRSGGARPA